MRKLVIVILVFSIVIVFSLPVIAADEGTTLSQEQIKNEIKADNVKIFSGILMTGGGCIILGADFYYWSFQSMTNSMNSFYGQGTTNILKNNMTWIIAAATVGIVLSLWGTYNWISGLLDESKFSNILFITPFSYTDQEMNVCTLGLRMNFNF